MGRLLPRIVAVALGMLTLGVVAAGCGGGNDQPVATTTSGVPVFDGSNDTINVTAGTQFVVALGVNPTTGYEWQLFTRGETGVSLKGMLYVPDPNPGGAEGVGGTERWTFDTIGAGSGTLEFRLFPPGGGSAEEITSFEVTVTS